MLLTNQNIFGIGQIVSIAKTYIALDSIAIEE
jgi:hypothetical protein